MKGFVWFCILYITIQFYQIYICVCVFGYHCFLSNFVLKEMASFSKVSDYDAHFSVMLFASQSGFH